MKRFLLTICIVITLSLPALAAHIKGGFFSYEYLGPGTGGTLKYKVTLTVYMSCAATGAQISNPINFSFFNAGSNQFIQNVSVPIASQYFLGKSYDDPCITENQQKCYYLVVLYTLPSIELPAIPEGYTIAYQRCCRIAGINNVPNSGNVGNTFNITIPGTATGQQAEINSSPSFLVNDTAVVCNNSFFQYSFKATDADGDLLTYSFCDAIQGGDAGTNSAPPTAANPPYIPVPYSAPFSGTRPMGPGVTIDPVTGLISGTAPALAGEYVVSVCVSEFRNGVRIATTRKELHVNVGNCVPIEATLDPQYVTCDGLTLTFTNNTPSSDISSYFWDFGVPVITNDTSDQGSPTYTYPAAGTYTIKLVTNRNQLCADSTTAVVKAYPGFFPAFTVTGSCFSNPFQFTDNSTTNYGVVNSWSWNFGDGSTLADTSHIKNPVWTYPGSATTTATLIVTNSIGCVDTAQVPVTILDKPAIGLTFRDTLICRNDAVQLNATGTGTFSWTPLANISNPNTASPTVNPPVTTWYYVHLDANGCLNNDSVRVRVVNAVSLTAMNDTTICQGDTIQLSTISNGLQYNWTPATGINNTSLLNPQAVVTNTTVYTVTAIVGSCRASDQVLVTTVPYPTANAGPDPVICYNTSVQLTGGINGSSFTWTPSSYLDNPNSLSPVSSPPRTTRYILAAWDTQGCPKPGYDTVLVTVLPKINPFAGRDTVVVVGQPLQFNGSGGTSYSWTPSTGLSNTSIPDPVGSYDGSFEYITYKLVVSNQAGCSDSAYVTVRVFKTVPSVFVPTAFTPNGDGLNDEVRPIVAGMKTLHYFRVYNRWGQQVFAGNNGNQGWDGRLNGVLQGTGVFVWMVHAEDYTGRAYFLKGTVTLIR